MKTKDQFVKEFQTDTSNLTPHELKVLEKLTQAARLIAPIYARQVDDRYPGANFYPHDATKEEIEREAQQNSNILDPYTIVERKNGKLYSLPFHQKYRKYLLPIAKLLKEAAEISDNRDFAHRLRVQADALLDGAYEAADIYWLTMQPYKIDIVIGPIERYDDKLTFTKCAYQAWIGIMDEESTNDAIRFKDFFVTARRMVQVPSEKVDFLNKLQVRVDNTILFSGLIARYEFTSTNLPNDVNLMEKYGSEITIFKPSIDLKFKIEHFPIFHSVFEETFQDSYSVELTKQGSLRNSYLHEISHPFLRYRDAEKRLKELFPYIDEIAASIYGVRACGQLLLKDIISQKELEAIIVMLICRGFSWWFDYLQRPSVLHYAKGFASALNFFLENGAICESGGFSWPNFTKLYVSIEELSSILEKILAFGTYKDAKNFLERYDSLEVFERFMPRLKTVRHIRRN
jgi:hypothetical protein